MTLSSHPERANREGVRAAVSLGALYDCLGFAAPFGVSAGLAMIGLLFAAIMVPEIRPPLVRSELPCAVPAQGQRPTLESLPRPLHVFFIFAFIEPEMVYYFYDRLGFTTTQFGLFTGGYGLAMVAGQPTLGGLSDRLGRRPVIAAGFSP